MEIVKLFVQLKTVS